MSVRGASKDSGKNIQWSIIVKIATPELRITYVVILTANYYLWMKNYGKIFLELCGKEFSDRATLQKHTLVHSTTKPHQCATCFMSFRHKSSLSRHNKIHLKVTECMYCKRSFRYESFLKKHLLQAHKGQQIIYIEETFPKEEIQQEGCSVLQ